MSRPRTATNILEARGAFKKDPQRRRAKEPKAKGSFPKSPRRDLSPEQKKTWKEIVKRVPDGVLTDADIFCVEIAACLLAEFRKSPDNMIPARLTRLSTELGKLGLSPSERTKLFVLKKERK